ncbi:MAG: glycosyltransferase [Clostridiales bacterium]|nr:glycosyltransferase [Clostridiales bacterium]
MDKKKIFVSAYACEPGKGSEIGVGWHWVLEMSKYYELWVMTRANNQEPIEAYILTHPDDNRNIHWVYYDLPDWVKRFKKGMRGVRIYYTLWQYGSNQLVKGTMQQNNIQIYHLLTYGNALWHVSKYGQKHFFVWGPTGGVDTIPSEYSRKYSFRNRMVEFARRTVVAMLPINIGFQNRCKNADLILCKATSTIQAISPRYRHKACIFTDVATDLTLEKYSQNFSSGIVEYLVIGKLDAWRGFDLLIEAFSEAVKHNDNIHLTIMGKGSDQKRLETLIHTLNMKTYVSMIGEVSMSEYRQYMINSDVIVNPCLKEGAVTVSFDAMSYGKPFICLDTGGYTRYFMNDYAIVLPRTSRNETVHNLTKAVLQTADSQERRRLSSAIVKEADKVSWQTKGEQIRDVIDEAYARRG